MRQTLHDGMVSLLSALVTIAVFSLPIMAHPGSGIVVDRRGEIYFVDTGSGVWKIDSHGELTHLPGPMFQWMTIDSDDCFSTAHLPTSHFLLACRFPELRVRCCADSQQIVTARSTSQPAVAEVCSRLALADRLRFFISF